MKAFLLIGTTTGWRRRLNGATASYTYNAWRQTTRLLNQISPFLLRRRVCCRRIRR